MKCSKVAFLPPFGAFILFAQAEAAFATCDPTLLQTAESLAVDVFITTSSATGLPSFETDQARVGGSSGILLSDEDGSSYVLTALHTFRNLDDDTYSYYIQKPRRELSLEDRLGEAYDAVLFSLDIPVTSSTNPPTLSRNLEAGTFVAVAGFPGDADEIDLPLSCDTGEFSGISNSKFSHNPQLVLDVLQYNIPSVNGPADSRGLATQTDGTGKGFSGAPVMDGDGRLVGMHLGASPTNELGEGLPISDLFDAFDASELPRFNFSDETEVVETPPEETPPDTSFNGPDAMSNWEQENMSFIPVVGSNDLLILQDSSITTNTPITDRHYESPPPEIARLNWSEINLSWQQNISGCLSGIPYLYSISKDEPVFPLELSNIPGATDQDFSIVANINENYVCSQILRDRL